MKTIIKSGLVMLALFGAMLGIASANTTNSIITCFPLPNSNTICVPPCCYLTPAGVVSCYSWTGVPNCCCNGIGGNAICYPTGYAPNCLTTTTTTVITTTTTIAANTTTIPQIETAAASGGGQVSGGGVPDYYGELFFREQFQNIGMPAVGFVPPINAKINLTTNVHIITPAVKWLGTDGIEVMYWNGTVVHTHSFNFVTYGGK